jgi:hypothetical protein
MAHVATLPHPLGFNFSPFPVGDADRDNRAEVYGVAFGDLGDTVLCFENAGSNTYQRFDLGIVFHGGLRCFGDGDRDGLYELLADSSEGLNSYVRVYESRDSWSLPSTKVWQAVTGLRCGTPLYTDLDHDGHREIAVSVDRVGIILFENSGDNRYDSVAVLEVPPFCYYRCFGTCDFDQDSLREMAAGHGQYVDVFEGTGNDNEYVLSATCSTGVWEDAARSLTVANDMDLDDYPEFVVLFQNALYEKLCVFEASSHAKYRIVWQRVLPVHIGGDKWVTSGDVDGDGIDEFAYSVQGKLRLFKCTGPDAYEEVWSVDSGSGLCRLYDLNGNGRDEVIFDVPRDSNWHCDIYEDTEGLGVTEFSEFSRESPVKVAPSVARLGASLLFSDIPPASDIEIHSLDGRLVANAKGVRQSDGTWDLRDQAGNLVPAGTYFAVIRNKGKATSLKLCVVK